MPNADAAHVSLKLLRGMGDGIFVGPILIGAARPNYIASQSVTVGGLLNLTALAAVEAQDQPLRRRPDEALQPVRKQKTQNAHLSGARYSL